MGDPMGPFSSEARNIDIRSLVPSGDYPYDAAVNDSEFLSWLQANGHGVTTPAYVYCENRLDEAAASLRRLMPEGARLFYSLKANPQTGIVRHLATVGIDAEVASAGERRICAAAGLSPAHTLIGGVSKSVEYLAEVCAAAPAGIVIESTTEWARLLEVVSANRTAQVLLRVNPGITLGGLDMAGSSQFGLSVEQAMAMARSCNHHPHTEFAGLHFYFGSQRLRVEPIVRMLRIVNDVIDKFRSERLHARIVDVGLGCGVPYLSKDEELDHNELRKHLMHLWQGQTWSQVELWSEAGRALVARSGYFVARVVAKKRLHGKTFVFLDGGLNVHNPGAGLGRVFNRNPRFLFLRHAGESISVHEEAFDLVGNLCTPADCLGRDVRSWALDEGDLVAIPNSGAYCQTTGLWGFNSQPLFSEAMLTRDGALTELCSQHSLQLRPIEASSLAV